MQTLIDAMCLCGRIFHAGDQNLCLREGFGERRDEWYGTALSHVDGFGTPGFAKGRTRRVVYGPGGVDCVRLANVARSHRDMCTPRGVLAKVTDQRVEVRFGIAAGRHAQTHLRASPRDQCG